MAPSSRRTALKSALEGFRSAIGLIKDVRDLGGPTDPAKSKAINDALSQAEHGARIAEAQIAQALGFELCRCEFPPTPMLTVGWIDNPNVKLKGQVYECPKCGVNTVGLHAHGTASHGRACLGNKSLTCGIVNGPPLPSAGCI